MKELVLIGGGGHCRSCIDVIEASKEYVIKGILDKQSTQGIYNYVVLGDDSLIPSLAKEGCHFLITLGQIKSAVVRKKLYEIVMAHSGQLATIISPSAIVSSRSKIGKGTIVMHGAIINAGTMVGDNNIINTGALLEHDVISGNHCHVSTHTVINGGCNIGNEVFIGSNAVLVNGVEVCSNVTIGAGSTINKNINQPGVYAGASFRKL